jgi:hypothetical protein
MNRNPLKIPCLKSGVKIEKSSRTKAHWRQNSLIAYIHSTKTAPQVEGDERRMQAKITFVSISRCDGKQASLIHKSAITNKRIIPRARRCVFFRTKKRKAED